MDKFLSLTVSGAVTGAIFSLVAAGLVLSYTATGIFNFSYGAVAFASAFIFYQLNTSLNIPIVPAAALVILVFAPLLGLLLDVAVFRPLARATESAKIMATVGLLIAIPALVTWLNDQFINAFNFDIGRSADVTQVGLPSGIGPTPKVDWKLPFNVPFDSNQLTVFIAAAVVAVALWLLLRHTPLGLQMRAVVDRADLANTRGINERTTSRYAWVIGMMLAATAGVVGAPIIGSLGLDAFISITFVAAAAAVLGGLRSVPLAFAGGLLLGALQNLVAGYVAKGEIFSFASGITGFNSSVPFILLLAGLVVMARDRNRRGGSAAQESPPPDYLADLPIWRRALPWTCAIIFVICYVEFLASDYWIIVIGTGLTLSLIFLSYVVITGLGGMVSLAQSMFVLAASLTTGMLIGRYGWSLFPALLLGVAVTVVLSTIVALPALRLGGLPLALATLALAFLGDRVLFQWNWLRNTQSGWSIPRPDIGIFDLNNNKTWAMFIFALCGLVALLIFNLKRSSWGRAIAATRSSEIAANTSGVSVLRVKIGVFALSAAIAGVGGVMYASNQLSITNGSVTVTTGLLWLATVVLFGIRRPAAAIWAGIGSAMSPVIFQSGIHFPKHVGALALTGVIVAFIAFIIVNARTDNDAARFGSVVVGALVGAGLAALLWPDFFQLSWDGTTSTEIPAILFGLGAVQLSRNPDGFVSITSMQNYARRMRRKAKRAAELGIPESTIAAVTQEEDLAAIAEAERHGHELVAEGAVRPSSGVPADAESDENAVLVLRGLHSGYGAVEVLHGIDLVVRGGEITALLGANGSGKTTLCSTISGLVPLREGSMTLHGADVTGQAAFRRARNGVLVAPESRGIFPGLSVEENLQLRLTSAAEREEVYDRFPVLKERRKLPAGSLSGGEQQMLALAPVLVNPPRLVVADEPTLGLAPLVVADIMRVFEELRDRGTAILLVEEKARNVLEIAEQVAFLELGHIVWSGPRGDIDDERLVATYLGTARG